MKIVVSTGHMSVYPLKMSTVNSSFMVLNLFRGLKKMKNVSEDKA